uniref:Uncharacterized protein n=1 Tax=Acrobeloides nanus TaxID=290746 RepID=A0A914DCN3_9BILA
MIRQMLDLKDESPWLKSVSKSNWYIVSVTLNVPVDIQGHLGKTLTGFISLRICPKIRINEEGYSAVARR